VSAEQPVDRGVGAGTTRPGVPGPSRLPCNLRDLGGLPVAGGDRLRHGVIFRSDDLAPADPARVRAIVRNLGVSTVLDLRSEVEVGELGRGALENERVELHHLPMSLTAASVGGDETTDNLPTTAAELASFYANGVVAAASTLARGLSLLAATDRPALFHFVAGKDRTGVLAALLLSAVGVPQDAIVEDYARTGANMAVLLGTQGLGSGVVDPERAARIRALPEVLLQAPASAMRACLVQLRHSHGSPLAPLFDAGLEEHEVATLRERLVE
jgi:protein-tyrosine phosphatase